MQTTKFIMFLRLILFTILGYFIIKTLRQIFLGTSKKPKVKENKRDNKEENFQQKNQSKIEDADFEELD